MRSKLLHAWYHARTDVIYFSEWDDDVGKFSTRTDFELVSEYAKECDEESIFLSDG